MSKLNKLTEDTIIGLGVLLVGYKLYKEYKQEQVDKGNSSSNAGAFGDGLRFERDKVKLDGNVILQSNYASQSELQDVERQLARTEGAVSELLSQFEKLRQDVDSIDEDVNNYMYRWEV